MNQESKKYWLKLNDSHKISFDYPLNPGFVFWLKRRFRGKVVSDGGERVSISRNEPFSDEELQEIYLETEHRQKVVST